MMNTHLLAGIGMAIGCACMGVTAQTVYRCGSSYSQAPCAGGQVVDTSDTMHTGQPGRGASAAERDAKAAAALEKDRLQLQAQAAPAYIPPSKEPAAQARKGAGKPRKPEQFTAVAPARPDDPKEKKKKKKSARNT